MLSALARSLRAAVAAGIGFSLTAAAAAAIQAPATEAGDPLDELLESTAGREGYRSPSADEVRRAEAAFVFLLRGERGEWLREQLKGLGFRLRSLDLGDERLTVVREARGRREGKGLYILRDEPAKVAAVALEAPHRPSDQRTGEIAARLMAEHPFAAAAWNTVPRREADLAHLERSFFNAFTRAFARAHPKGSVVQLHGFDAERREAERDVRAAMVVSDGTRDPSRRARQATACLRRLEVGDVLAFPADIDELGATTNANAAALRELGKGEFLHLEMAPELRRALAGSADLRRRFAGCLIGGSPG